MTQYADHYTHRVRWSAEDKAFVGTVAEMASLSWGSSSQLEAQPTPPPAPGTHRATLGLPPAVRA